MTFSPVLIHELREKCVLAGDHAWSTRVIIACIAGASRKSRALAYAITRIRSKLANRG